MPRFYFLLRVSQGQSKRGGSPSFYFFPLSFEGEGDTGGEVDKRDRFASLAMTGKGEKGMGLPNKNLGGEVDKYHSNVG